MMTSLDCIAGAQAKFAMFVASLLERAGLTPMREFADLLGIFAETVADTDPEEAALLKSWADAIRSTPTH